MSEAMASREAQSSITERKEETEGLVSIESSIGLFVLKGKANLSHDCGKGAFQNGAMARANPKTDFKADFCARVKAARIKKGLKQWQIAEILGMDQGTYKQYEGRSYMPHDLIPTFCLACDIDVSYLFTGRRPAHLKSRAA